MSPGIIVVIVIAAIIVAAAAVWIVVDGRRRGLRQRFGPEYDRLAQEHGGRRAAEAELTERQRRVAQLNIRPLSPEERARYSNQWTAIQEEFVERPQEALKAATGIITSAMRDRGYPTEDYEQMVADLSVDHSRTITQFRHAHDMSTRAATGTVSTEDLRQAMIGYREVFDDIVGIHSDRAETQSVAGAGAQPGGGPAAADGSQTTAVPPQTANAPQTTVREEPAQRAEWPQGSPRR